MKVRDILELITYDTNEAYVDPSPSPLIRMDWHQVDLVHCVNTIHGGALGSLSKFFVVF